MDEESRALTGSLQAFYDYDSTARLNIIKLRQEKLARLKELEETRELKEKDTRSDKSRMFINYHQLASKIIEPQLETISNCISNNSYFLESVANVAKVSFQAPESKVQWSDNSISEISKVVGLLAQVAREWSTEGIEERDQSLGKVIKEIEDMFPELEPQHIVEQHRQKPKTPGEDQDQDQINNSDTIILDHAFAEYLNKQEDELTEEDRTQLVRKRQSVKVVIPGCGLGRLALELAARGFDAQGNEVSFPMIFTSNFLLNHTTGANGYKLHPWVHSFSHVKSTGSQTRSVTVPDVHPEEFLTRRMRVYGKSAGELSMIMGSFDEIYPMTLEEADEMTQKEVNEQEDDTDKSVEEKALIPNTIKQVDVVATVFFIDTSPNIFKTLDVISQILVSGGVWINFGPLLWHYEHSIPLKKSKDQDTSMKDVGNGHHHVHHSDYEKEDDRSAGLELSLDDLLNLLPVYGLQIVKHESDIPCHYALDKLSMRSHAYNCEYWVAKKIK